MRPLQRRFIVVFGQLFHVYFADSVLYNHHTTAAEVHKQIGQHLKLAPYREGGAGKGARVIDGNPYAQSLSDVQLVNDVDDVDDDKDSNGPYASESSVHESGSKMDDVDSVEI